VSGQQNNCCRNCASVVGTIPSAASNAPVSVPPASSEPSSNPASRGAWLAPLTDLASAVLPCGMELLGAESPVDDSLMGTSLRDSEGTAFAGVADLAVPAAWLPKCPAPIEELILPDSGSEFRHPASNAVDLESAVDWAIASRDAGMDDAVPVLSSTTASSGGLCNLCESTS